MPLRVRLTATSDPASVDWLNRCLGIGINVFNALSRTVSTSSSKVVVELTFPGALAGDRFLSLFSNMTDAPLLEESAQTTFLVEPL